jgi:hypothetical protein
LRFKPSRGLVRENGVSVAVIPQGCVGVFPQWFLVFCSS